MPDCRDAGGRQRYVGALRLFWRRSDWGRFVLPGIPPGPTETLRFDAAGLRRSQYFGVVGLFQGNAAKRRRRQAIKTPANGDGICISLHCLVFMYGPIQLLCDYISVYCCFNWIHTIIID